MCLKSCGAPWVHTQRPSPPICLFPHQEFGIEDPRVEASADLACRVLTAFSALCCRMDCSQHSQQRSLSQTLIEEPARFPPKPVCAAQFWWTPEAGPTVDQLVCIFGSLFCFPEVACLPLPASIFGFAKIVWTQCKDKSDPCETSCMPER